MQSNYQHTQRAPLCLIVYATAVPVLIAGLVLNEPPLPWLSIPVSLLLLTLAASFHHLTVEDGGDRLMIRFGPIPLFRRSVRYEDIVTVETGRTMLLDGWGIHLSLRGGWVWNLWGRDCVVLHLRNGLLRLGTDDATQLADFLKTRLDRTQQSP